MPGEIDDRGDRLGVEFESPLGTLHALCATGFFPSDAQLGDSIGPSDDDPTIDGTWPVVAESVEDAL